MRVGKLLKVLNANVCVVDIITGEVYYYYNENKSEVLNKKYLKMKIVRVDVDDAFVNTTIIWVRFFKG